MCVKEIIKWKQILYLLKKLVFYEIWAIDSGTIFATKTDMCRNPLSSLKCITLLPCSFKTDCSLVLKINTVSNKGAKQIPTQVMEQCCNSFLRKKKKRLLQLGKGYENKRSTVLSSFICIYLWCHLVTDTVARFRYFNNLYYQSLIDK